MQIVSFGQRDALPSNDPSPERELLSHDITLPLVVDLDGTLIATDTLQESLIFFLKRRGAEAWKVPYWICAGRAIVKNRLAEVVTEEDVASFPLNARLVRFAEQEASNGRQIVLATASDVAIAQKVQQRFPFISHVIASTDGHNLKGQAKAEKVSRQFAHGGTKLYADIRSVVGAARCRAIGVLDAIRVTLAGKPLALACAITL